MKAVVYHDVGDIRLEDVPEPRILAPTDAIVRITASAICGTHRGETKAVVSIVLSPASASRATSAALISADTGTGSF